MARRVLSCMVVGLLSSCAASRTAAPGPVVPVVDRAGPAAPVAPRTTKGWVRSEPPASLPPSARAEPVSWKYRLSNGLQLVVVENHRRPVVSARLILPSGSAADSADKAGATYFAVALLTDTFDEKNGDGYPVVAMEKSARRQVAELGGALRFDVMDDASWVSIDGFASGTAAYLGRLASIVQKPRHGDDSFAGRHEGLADAINEQELTDSTVLEEHLSQLAFGDAHPYSRSSRGTPESLSSIGLEDIIERQAALLSPRGATLLVVGDVDAKAVQRAAEASLGRWRGGDARPALRLAPPPVETRRTVMMMPRKPASTTLVCSARPLSDVTATSEELAVLAAIASQRRLSPLLREERGLTYDVAASVVHRKSARALLFCSRVKASETAEGLRLFLAGLGGLVTTPPTPEEVNRAVQGLVSEYESAQDDVAGTVRFWTGALAVGGPTTAAAHVAALKAVTPASLAKLAALVLRPATQQIMMAGDPAVIHPALRANALGQARVPKLAKVEDD